MIVIIKQELDGNVMEGLTSALLMLTTDNSPRWLISITIMMIMVIISDHDFDVM